MKVETFPLKNFKLAVENAYDHIIITDPQGVILYANTAAEKITGFKVGEMLGKKAGSKELWGGQMSAEFYKQMWETISIKKKGFKGEIKNKRKNGQLYYAKVSINPVLENDEIQFFVAIERDITKEKRLEEQKNQILSLAAHQLRTPLSSLKWFSDVLLKDGQQVSEKQKDYLKQLSVSTHKMIRLVNSLLNMTKLELGEELFNLSDININQSIEEVKADFTYLLEQKKIKFIKNVDVKATTLHSDKNMFNHILENLFSNACKYTPESGTVSVEVQLENDGILLSVSDDGYGIPQEDQTFIFDKLFRAKNVEKLDTEGAGIGLYLVKVIVEKLGGKIWFESQVNKGTTFFVYLPNLTIDSTYKEKILPAEIVV